MSKPKLHKLWYLWRLIGFVWRYIVKAWRKLKWIGRDSSKNNTLLYKLYKRLNKHMWYGNKNSYLRKLIWKLDIASQFGCPHCGYDGWIELDDEKEYFECTNSGSSSDPEIGTYYWWEGWRTCPRCGYKEYIHEDSA